MDQDLLEFLYVLDKDASVTAEMVRTGVGRFTPERSRALYRQASQKNYLESHRLMAGGKSKGTRYYALAVSGKTFLGGWQPPS